MPLPDETFPSASESPDYLKEKAKALYDSLHPSRVFSGQGDTPEEALDNAMEGMRRLEEPLESTPRGNCLTLPRSDSFNEPLLQLFQYEHLPPYLQAISAPFCNLARQVVATLPRNPERTVCLRKLSEAKDAAITAKLWKEVG